MCKQTSATVLFVGKHCVVFVLHRSSHMRKDVVHRFITACSRLKCRTSVKLYKHLFRQSQASIALNNSNTPTKGFVTHATPGHDGFLSNGSWCMKGWTGNSTRLITYWLKPGDKHGAWLEWSKPVISVNIFFLSSLVFFI